MSSDTWGRSNWTLFDIETVDALKRMKGRFDECNEWIAEQWQGGLDIAETYDLETQRLVLFGREALDIAIRMRLRANLDRGEHSGLGNLEHHLDGFRKRYQSRNGAKLLPEMEQMFELEPTSLTHGRVSVRATKANA